MRALRDESSGRLLLGDNTGGGTVIVAADQVPACLEFGFQLDPYTYMVYHMCTHFRLAPYLNVTTAEFGECLCTSVLRSLWRALTQIEHTNVAIRLGYVLSLDRSSRHLSLSLLSTDRMTRRSTPRLILNQNPTPRLWSSPRLNSRCTM
jgi:hypothetical protein